jgi:hypothetical protein
MRSVEKKKTSTVNDLRACHNLKLDYNYKEQIVNT